MDAMTANQPMTAEQAATLKRLAEATYELDAFKPNLTRAEADLRIAMLTAKAACLRKMRHRGSRRISRSFRIIYCERIDAVSCTPPGEPLPNANSA